MEFVPHCYVVAPIEKYGPAFLGSCRGLQRHEEMRKNLSTNNLHEGKESYNKKFFVVVIFSAKKEA